MKKSIFLFGIFFIFLQLLIFSSFSEAKDHKLDLKCYDEFNCNKEIQDFISGIKCYDYGCVNYVYMNIEIYYESGKNGLKIIDNEIREPSYYHINIINKQNYDMKNIQIEFSKGIKIIYDLNITGFTFKNKGKLSIKVHDLTAGGLDGLNIKENHLQELEIDVINFGGKYYIWDNTIEKGILHYKKDSIAPSHTFITNNNIKEFYIKKTNTQTTKKHYIYAENNWIRDDFLCDENICPRKGIFSTYYTKIKNKFLGKMEVSCSSSEDCEEKIKIALEGKFTKIFVKLPPIYDELNIDSSTLRRADNVVLEIEGQGVCGRPLNIVVNKHRSEKDEKEKQFKKIKISRCRLSLNLHEKLAIEELELFDNDFPNGLGINANIKKVKIIRNRIGKGVWSRSLTLGRFITGGVGPLEDCSKKFKSKLQPDSIYIARNDIEGYIIINSDVSYVLLDIEKNIIEGGNVKGKGIRCAKWEKKFTGFGWECLLEEVSMNYCEDTFSELIIRENVDAKSKTSVQEYVKVAPVKVCPKQDFNVVECDFYDIQEGISYNFYMDLARTQDTLVLKRGNYSGEETYCITEAFPRRKLKCETKKIRTKDRLNKGCTIKIKNLLNIKKECKNFYSEILETNKNIAQELKESMMFITAPSEIIGLNFVADETVKNGIYLLNRNPFPFQTEFTLKDNIIIGEKRGFRGIIEETTFPTISPRLKVENNIIFPIYKDSEGKGLSFETFVVEIANNKICFFKTDIISKEKTTGKENMCNTTINFSDENSENCKYTCNEEWFNKNFPGVRKECREGERKCCDAHSYKMCSNGEWSPCIPCTSGAINIPKRCENGECVSYWQTPGSMHALTKLKREEKNKALIILISVVTLTICFFLLKIMKKGKR